MNTTTVLGGITWTVSRAARWPNVAWLEAVGQGAVLVFERHDGLWGLSRPGLAPRSRAEAVDRVLRSALGVPAISPEPAATLRVVR